MKNKESKNYSTGFNKFSEYFMRISLSHSCFKVYVITILAEKNYCIIIFPDNTEFSVLTLTK